MHIHNNLHFYCELTDELVNSRRIFRIRWKNDVRRLNGQNGFSEWESEEA